MEDSFTCSCGHVKGDHTAYLVDPDIYAWPIDKLCGECYCEHFVPDNLRHLENLSRSVKA